MKQLNGLALGLKLPLIMVFLVTLTIVVMTAANFLLTETVIKRSAAEKLETAARFTAKRVENLLTTIDRDLRLKALKPDTAQALIAMRDGYEALDNPEATLREVYVTNNPYPAAERDLLVSADTGSSYGFIHNIYHPTFDAHQNEMGYYDMFLFDPDGNLVYSVFKGADFATNLLTGPWQESGLADVFRKAVAQAPGAETAFIDFKPYEPSAFAPAAFAARPVFDSEQALLGVLAIRMPITELSEAARDLVKLGSTADGFIVGSDNLLRTNSRMTEGDDVLQTTVEGAHITNGLSGEADIFDSTGLLGQRVMGYHVPVEALGANWIVVVQQDISELLSGAQWATRQALLISLAIFAGVVLVSVLFARGISEPVKRLTASVKRVADGNLDEEVPEGDRGDEIGALARAAEVFRQNALKMDALNREQQAAHVKMEKLNQERDAAAQREKEMTAQQEEAKRAAEEARAQMMAKLGASFGEVVIAAVAGNFQKRIDADFDDETLISLAKNINTLMEAIDDGLTQTGTLIEWVAGGDLTQHMTGEFQGAFAELQLNMNTMIDALRQLAGDISASGTTLEESSNELRQTSDSLSRQAEQNAAAVEETSAALEELSASLKNTDTNISAVSQSARDARKTAEASENIAAEAAASMDRISAGSGKISQVTEVINEIAFQINLLALNAGVEAARAGEAGLGFSVVASEVRQLAQRASEAAKEISDVILESDEAVAEGVSKVASAKSSLEGIAHSVVQISESVTEVTTAISEQSAGVGEITSAIAQIDTNTQKQAASFEEVTASSHVLAEQARDLRQTTARFQLDEDRTDPSFTTRRTDQRTTAA